MRRVRRNNRKAFTLAELLVVIAIIAIVAAIGILQLAKAKKDLQVKANDGNAKLIYLAAQNQLLQMKEFGQWDALLASEVEDDELNKAYFGYTLANPGHASPLGGNDDGDDENSSLKPSDYQAFFLKEDQPTLLRWEEIQGDMRVAEHVPNQGGTHSGVVDRMLPLGTVEDYVRTEGKYIIEYDARTASVYGVFYTESQEGQLDYTEENFTQLFYGDGGQGRPYEAIGALQGVDETIARRLRRDYTGSNQKESILGYFGGSMAYGLDYTPLEIPEVRIDNGEELILYIRDTNLNGNMPGDEIQIIVTGKLGGSVTYELRGDALSGYYLYNDGNFLERYLVRNGGLSDDGTAYEYEIVLDSITPGPDNVNWHFAYNFCDETNSPVLGLIAGDDIEVTVLAKPVISTEYPRVALPVSRTVETNSLFSASVMDAANNTVTTAKIAQLRHLENLSYEISNADFANDSKNNKLNVVFENSVSFDGNGDNLLPLVPKDYTGKTITRWNGSAFSSFVAGSFIPIDFESGINPKILGGSNNVYNICITVKSNISDDVADDLSVGLLGSVNGTLMISDLGIVSSETATAEQSAEIKTVYQGNVGAMGAFVGYIGGKVSLTNCWSTVQLRSTNAVAGSCIGGLIGVVFAEDNNPSEAGARINGCYVSGRTINGEFSTDVREANIYVDANEKSVNVGGLVGSCNAVDVVNSYCSADIGLTTPSNAGSGLPNNQKPVYKIGGLAGNVTGRIRIVKSYFAGWMNLPVAVEPRDDFVLFGGFVGWGRSNGGVVVDTRSFWIKEFLGITNLEENPVNGDHGMFLSQALQLGSTPADSYPYDNTLYDVAYVYPDVTGLGHHWGDWCKDQPPIGLYFIAGAGVELIAPHSSCPLPLDPNPTWDGDSLVFHDVPANILCTLGAENDPNANAGNTVRVTLEDGFSGVKFYENGDEEILAYNQENPGTLPANLENGYYYFVTTGKTAVIYVRAEKLLDPGLQKPDDETKVFNYEDTVVTPTITQTYGDSVHVRTFLAYTPYWDSANNRPLLPVDINPSVDGLYVKHREGAQFVQYNPNNSYPYLIDTSLDPRSEATSNNPFANDSSSYSIPKDNHYGKLYCRVFVFAYCDVDANSALDPIFSTVEQKDFSVTLKRAPVKFVYDDSNAIGNNWWLDGGQVSLMYYTEYGSDKLYTADVGTTVLVPLGNNGQKFSNTAGTYLLSLPTVTFADSGNYAHGFDILGWKVQGTTEFIYDSSGIPTMLKGYSTTGGLNSEKVWKLSNFNVVELHSGWGLKKMPISIDLNGGYWETVESATPPGGGA